MRPHACTLMWLPSLAGIARRAYTPHCAQTNSSGAIFVEADIYAFDRLKEIGGRLKLRQHGHERIERMSFQTGVVVEHLLGFDFVAALGHGG